MSGPSLRFARVSPVAFAPGLQVSFSLFRDFLNPLVEAENRRDIFILPALPERPAEG
jgi:hypothetical protein